MKALKEMRKNQKGFTLVEIMIVVLIIGILLSIAIPNFVRAREKSMEKACIANLKTIDSAVQQYMMENKGVVPTYPTDLVGADKYIKSEPQCPRQLNRTFLRMALQYVKVVSRLMSCLVRSQPRDLEDKIGRISLWNVIHYQSMTI